MGQRKSSLALTDPSEPSTGPCRKTCDAKLFTPLFSGGVVTGRVDNDMRGAY